MTPKDRLRALYIIFSNKLPNYKRDLTHMTLCFDEPNIHRIIWALLEDHPEKLVSESIELKLEDGMKLNEGMKG